MCLCMCMCGYTVCMYVECGSVNGNMFILLPYLSAMGVYTQLPMKRNVTCVCVCVCAYRFVNVRYSASVRHLILDSPKPRIQSHAP